MGWPLRWDGFSPGWSSRFVSTTPLSILPGTGARWLESHIIHILLPHLCGLLSYTPLLTFEKLCVTVKVITVLSVRELAKSLWRLEGALKGCVLHHNRLQTVCCTSTWDCFDYSCYSILICAPKVQQPFNNNSIYYCIIAVWWAAVTM